MSSIRLTRPDFSSSSTSARWGRRRGSGSYAGDASGSLREGSSSALSGRSSSARHWSTIRNRLGALVARCRQERRQDQDQDSGYDARDVGNEITENHRDLPYPKSVCCHHDGDDENEPENQLAQYGRGRLPRFRSLEELPYATSLHPALKAYCP